MITLKSAKTLSEEVFPHIEYIYLESFPPEERREWTDMTALLMKGTGFDMLTAWDEGRLIGFITVWDMGDFVFMEHFATAPDARNKGYGAQIFKSVLDSDPRPHVIEVERPDTELAARRIGFYQRTGMEVTDTGYMQPPYSDNGKWIPMYIMCDRKDGYKAEWTAMIQRTVYGINEQQQITTERHD